MELDKLTFFFFYHFIFLSTNTKDQDKSNGAIVSSSKSSKINADSQNEPDKLEEELSDKNQNKIVSSLAEKAMSVASPVVPTKEDGEVDQERSYCITCLFLGYVELSALYVGFKLIHV